MSQAYAAIAAFLDLNYREDSNADLDANFIMNDKGEMVEIQATGEKRLFDQQEFLELLELAKIGVNELITAQKEALKIN